jgi:Flp pilus assembly protein TadG
MLKIGFLPQLLNRKGQSIVEVSLITPLVLIALYIPADFGIAFLAAHLTQNAVREAARIGASQETFDSAAIRSEALSRMPARLTSKTVTATLHTTGSVNCAQFVEVTGQGTYNYFFYQILRLLGATVPNTQLITRTARMRYEFQPTTYHTPCT